MKAKSLLKTLSLSQIMNADRIGTDEIYGDLERAVDRITGATSDEVAEDFIRVIALIRAAEDVNVRDLLISKVLDYAYIRTGQHRLEEYISSLFKPKGGEA